tara:strand:- start:14605 stop:15462 length:858 start_codon:yes stop_codon:yes gene_type:complete
VSHNAIEWTTIGNIMAEVVVIKFGGGLITNKSKMCTPDLGIIDQLVGVVVKCLDSGMKVIVVHGAGSFGHLRSKHWRLQEGLIEDIEITPQDDCKSQKMAVGIVRNEMLTLNSIIVEAFSKQGVSSITLPPHKWAKNTGSNFHGEILETFTTDKDVAITFGDVVDCDEGEFGILSGDDLVVRICQDVPNVSRLVFAIKGVDGILRRPPELATSSDLIENWSPSVEFKGVHNKEIDVTGGIGLKAHRGAEVAALGIQVLIVNGEYPDRIYRACTGLPTRGTQIFSE